MLITPVPKATIDKYGNPLPAENKVGISDDPFMTAPAAQPISTQNGYKSQLSSFVATRPNCGHDT
jgi:hypothetical protein